MKISVGAACLKVDVLDQCLASRTMNEIDLQSPCIVNMGCDPEATPARRFHGPHGCDPATSDHGTALKRYKLTARRVQYMVISGGGRVPERRHQ